ncbi:MAG: SRPBCC domain-containing protein [Planctomycetota bacterium]
MTTPVSVTLTRTFAAPIDLVWRAFTDADLVVRWMKCEPGVELEYDGWRPVVGAVFSSVMRKPGQWEVKGTGRFLEVEPHRVLAYQQDPNAQMNLPAMTVRVELAAVAGGTQVTLTHTGIPSDTMRGIIEGGWTGSLQLLRAQLDDRLGRRGERSHG